MEAWRWMVHIASSRRLRRNQVEDGWVDVTCYIDPCYAYFTVFYILDARSILVLGIATQDSLFSILIFFSFSWFSREYRLLWFMPPIFFCWHLFISCSVRQPWSSLGPAHSLSSISEWCFSALTLLLPPVSSCSSCANFIPAPAGFVLPWSSCIPHCFSIRCSVSRRCINDSFSIAGAHQDFLFFGRVLPSVCLRVLLQAGWPRSLLLHLSSQSGGPCSSSSRVRGLCFHALDFSLLSKDFLFRGYSAGCLREQLKQVLF
jgi:hypothetical protein